MRRGATRFSLKFLDRVSYLTLPDMNRPTTLLPILVQRLKLIVDSYHTGHGVPSPRDLAGKWMGSSKAPKSFVIILEARVVQRMYVI